MPAKLNKGTSSIANMQLICALIMFATLAQAIFIPMPPIQIRDTLHNSTVSSSVDQSTQVDSESTFNHSTAAWRMYIAFLVLGILAAIIMFPAVCSADVLTLCRSRRKQEVFKQHKVDVELAALKMREMLQEPEGAYLRNERYR